MYVVKHLLIINTRKESFFSLFPSSRIIFWSLVIWVFDKHSTVQSVLTQTTVSLAQFPKKCLHMKHEMPAEDWEAGRLAQNLSYKLNRVSLCTVIGHRSICCRHGSGSPLHSEMCQTMAILESSQTWHNWNLTTLLSCTVFLSQVSTLLSVI